MRLLKAEDRKIHTRADNSDDDAHERETAGSARVQNGIGEVIQPGKNRQAKRAGQEGERIDPANDSRAEEGGDENHGQDVVLSRLPGLIAIGLNELLAAL